MVAPWLEGTAYQFSCSIIKGLDPSRKQVRSAGEELRGGSAALSSFAAAAVVLAGVGRVAWGSAPGGDAQEW